MHRICTSNCTNNIPGEILATFTKLASGWRAQVRIKGVSESQNFRTKGEAQTWAAKTEHALRSGDGKVQNKHTVADLLNKYAKEVAPTKPVGDWEKNRIKAFISDYPKLADRIAHETDSSHFAEWRDDRLKSVKGSTIVRDISLFSFAFNVARREWKWIKHNPWTDVRRPEEPPPRERRIAIKEMEAMQMLLGYSKDMPPETASARVGAAFEFAIETAMRSGEICNLQTQHVFLEDRYAHIPKSKNGDKRNVALSNRAIEIVKQMGDVKADLKGTVFGLTPGNRDALFRKARGDLFDDLRFHDSRHEAITRLAQRLQILDLARMVGTRDLKTLMVYYNMHARDVAKLLG